MDIHALGQFKKGDTPLNASDIAIEVSAHISVIREDEGQVTIKAACNDVLSILKGKALRLLLVQVPNDIHRSRR